MAKTARAAPPATAAAGRYHTLRVRVQAAVPYTKHLFLKAHGGEAGEEVPTARALFVAGLPLCVASDDLVQLFSVFGDVAALALHPSEVTGILVFAEEAGCAAALEAAAGGAMLKLEPSPAPAPAGLKAWVAAHKATFPGNKVLQQQLDGWMERHDEEQERRRRAAEAEPDDGWTVVKRQKGRQMNTDGEGTSVGGVSAYATATAGASAQAKEKLLPHFYRFQQREKRRDELLELREQFENDKRKIQALKAARRFKPL